MIERRSGWGWERTETQVRETGVVQYHDRCQPPFSVVHSTRKMTREMKEENGVPERGRASLLRTEGDRSASIFFQLGVLGGWTLQHVTACLGVRG